MGYCIIDVPYLFDSYLLVFVCLPVCFFLFLFCYFIGFLQLLERFLICLLNILFRFEFIRLVLSDVENKQKDTFLSACVYIRSVQIEYISIHIDFYIFVQRNMTL